MDTNLKKYIEDLLVSEMKDMDDAEVYKYLVAFRPDGKVMLNDKEQSDFENWLEQHNGRLPMNYARYQPDTPI